MAPNPTESSLAVATVTGRLLLTAPLLNYINSGEFVKRFEISTTDGNFNIEGILFSNKNTRIEKGYTGTKSSEGTFSNSIHLYVSVYVNYHLLCVKLSPNGALQSTGKIPVKTVKKVFLYLTEFFKKTDFHGVEKSSNEDIRLINFRLEMMNTNSIMDILPEHLSFEQKTISCGAKMLHFWHDPEKCSHCCCVPPCYTKHRKTKCHRISIKMHPVKGKYRGSSKIQILGAKDIKEEQWTRLELLKNAKINTIKTKTSKINKDIIKNTFTVKNSNSAFLFNKDSKPTVATFSF